MCGRYGFIPGKNFYKRYNIDEMLDRLDTMYNVSPGRFMPVVVRNSPNKAVLMRWGLIPRWAKDPAIGYKMINARAESIHEKPAFKSLLTTKRCLIPASGFYEWKKTDKDKTPYYIHVKNRELISFAGLYDSWKDPEGKEIKSYTVITTQANALISQIHDRMPVILNPEGEEAWLNPEEKDENILLSLLKPYNPTGMKMYQVSKLVNKASSEGEMLIKPQNDINQQNLL